MEEIKSNEHNSYSPKRRLNRWKISSFVLGLLLIATFAMEGTPSLENSLSGSLSEEEVETKYRDLWNALNEMCNSILSSDIGITIKSEIQNIIIDIFQNKWRQVLPDWDLDDRSLYIESKDNFIASPDPKNMLHWYFVVFGIQEEAYKGGYYLGYLTFPEDYPWKPPSIMLLTSSGRFEPK